MRKITICALALAGTLTIAAPATAAKPKSGTFKLEIEGEQLTTWTYEKQQQPSCDWPESESGRQYIEFGTYDFGETARPKVKVKRAPGGGVALDFVRDDITMTAEAQLERNYRSLYTQQTECPGGGGPFGGDGPPQDAIGTNKCRVLGELDLYIGSSIEEVEDPSYPTGLADAKPPKAGFFFAGGPYWGSTPDTGSLPAECSDEGQPNADIGIVESQGEWAGAVIPAGASLAAKDVLTPKSKKTTVEFSRSVKYPNEVQTYGGPPHTNGKTVMDATFTFTRVKR